MRLHTYRTASTKGARWRRAGLLTLPAMPSPLILCMCAQAKGANADAVHNAMLCQACGNKKGLHFGCVAPKAGPRLRLCCTGPRVRVVQPVQLVPSRDHEKCRPASSLAPLPPSASPLYSPWCSVMHAPQSAAGCLKTLGTASRQATERTKKCAWSCCACLSQAGRPDRRGAELRLGPRHAGCADGVR